MIDVQCDYCGMEDGTFAYGRPGDDEYIGPACLSLVLRDIEDQRQSLIFEERWRTIQAAEPTSWAVHLFHNVPASWCLLCRVPV